MHNLCSRRSLGAFHIFSLFDIRLIQLFVFDIYLELDLSDP